MLGLGTKQAAILRLFENRGEQFVGLLRAQFFSSCLVQA